jgi:hypothetical protein
MVVHNVNIGVVDNFMAMKTNPITQLKIGKVQKERLIKGANLVKYSPPSNQHRTQYPLDLLQFIMVKIVHQVTR